MIQPSLRSVALMLAVAMAISGCSGAESRKQSFIASGQQHMKQHDWQKARLDFRNALQIDPKSTPLQMLAAQAAERSGEYREAAGLYQAVMDHEKTSSSARAALGRLYVGGGLGAEAIKLAEEGLILAPQDADLLTVRGAGRAQRGDLAGALQDAETAAGKAPGNVDAAALLGSLYARAGRLDEATLIVARAVAAEPGNINLRNLLARLLAGAGRGPEAEQQLTRVVAIEPGVLQHRYKLAQFYVLQKNIDAAEKVLRQAVALAPADIEPKLALANLIASQRSFEVADKGLNDLIAADPKNLDLRLGLGQFYESHQRPGLAESLYSEIIRAAGDKPQGLVARNRIATLELAAHRSEHAGQLIAEVLAVSAHDNEALTMRAGIALARGDTGAAIADLRTVLRDQPDAPGIMRALAQAYAVNGDAALAEETLRAAMRANPGDMPTRLALAQLLMGNGRGDEAQSVADQLVADQPGDVASLEAAFRVQVSRRDLAGARQSAVAVQTLRPDLPNGYYLGGLVDEAGGKPDAARQLFERASRAAPQAIEPIAAAARVDLSQRQPNRALARIDAALVSAPKDAALHDLKGEVLTQLKRPDEAVAVLNEAIALSPTWWVPYRDLQVAELGRGRQEAAIAALQRGVAATQAAPSLVTELASALERSGRIEEASAQYEAWLRRDPGADIAANNYAMLLVTHRAKDQHSLDRALQLAKRLEKSTRPAYLDTYGWVRYVRGEFGPAVAALQRAVDAGPDEPIFRAHLGLAQFRAGQRGEARRNLKQALSKVTDFPEQPEASSALAALRRGT